MNTKYIITAKQWRDKANGNSYFSCRIESTNDRDLLVKLPMQYGYGDSARYEAVEYLQDNGLITKKISHPGAHSELPIHYTMIENCLKRDVIAWGAYI